MTNTDIKCPILSTLENNAHSFEISPTPSSPSGFMYYIVHI